MTATWISGHFSDEALKRIALKSPYYEWLMSIAKGRGVFFDGLTMVKMIFDIILSNTTVRSDNFCKNNQNCCMEKHKHSIKVRMEFIEHNWKEIRQHDKSYHSLQLHVFYC